MKNIIIFGPPGTGKGTVSSRLAEEFGFVHISTGEIIRKNQKERTKIGLLADKMVDAGNLLPDDIVNEMVKQEIIDNKDAAGFVFDGYPRTPGQTRVLDQFLMLRKTPINFVINLDTPKWIVLERIIKRGETSGRADDNKEAFGARWTTYVKETQPSLSYFNGRGLYTPVDGNQTIEEVYTEVKNLING